MAQAKTSSSQIYINVYYLQAEQRVTSSLLHQARCNPAILYFRFRSKGFTDLSTK